MRAARLDVWVETAGLGHITRQLALMEVVRAHPDADGISIRFIIDSNPVIRSMVTERGYEAVIREDDIAAAARKLAAEWMTAPPVAFVMDSVDHDRHGECRQLLGWRGVVSLGVIDDPEDRDAAATLVLNALPGESRFAGRPDRMRGAEYLIHSPDFAEYHDRERDVPARARRGFVFFGGADGNNMTPAFLDAIEGMEQPIDWTVLLGLLYPQADAALARIRPQGLSMRVIRQTDALARELWEADLAVLATGNVLGEAIAVGVPIVGFAQTPVQDIHARYFRERCGFSYLGMFSDATPARLRNAIEMLAADREARARMRSLMRATVDGKGARRVADKLFGCIAERQP